MIRRLLAYLRQPPWSLAILTVCPACKTAALTEQGEGACRCGYVGVSWGSAPKVRRPTLRDLERGEQLAREHGWP